MLFFLIYKCPKLTGIDFVKKFTKSAIVILQQHILNMQLKVTEFGYTRLSFKTHQLARFYKAAVKAYMII